jgi:N utilization substance protein A
MANELLTVLEYIEQERGISRESLIKALETAILTASRKSIHPANELKVRIDPPTGKVQAWAILTVVDKDPNCDQLLIARAKERHPDVKVGDVIEWEVTPSNFGRIAAQTARQTIIQQLRKAEKENVQEEFADRVGQIVNGVVRRFEGGNIIIDFQKAEGIMPAREKIHDEQYMEGDHINAVLLKVDVESSGPSLIVSRATPEFVARLFEREVSEIHDGIVKIMGIAREPGRRTKIAVSSSDPRIDPVGACVGIRGARVRRITDELGSERIDIVPYDEDIRKYAAKALLPAAVESISLNESKHELTAVVNDEQSRIAFGRKAQNVRLAAKLIGWNISIVNTAGESPTAKIAEQMQAAAKALSDETGIAIENAAKLVRNGFVTVDGLLAADPEAIFAVEGIDADDIKAALDRLNNK